MRISPRQIRMSWTPPVGLFGPRRRYLAGFPRLVVDLSSGAGSLLAGTDDQTRPSLPFGQCPHSLAEGRVPVLEEAGDC